MLFVDYAFRTSTKEHKILKQQNTDETACVFIPKQSPIFISKLKTRKHLTSKSQNLKIVPYLNTFCVMKILFTFSLFFPPKAKDENDFLFYIYRERKNS